MFNNKKNQEQTFQCLDSQRIEECIGFTMMRIYFVYVCHYILEHKICSTHQIQKLIIIIEK